MLAKDAERTGMKRCRLCWVKEDELTVSDMERKIADNPEDAELHNRIAAKYITLTRYDDAYDAAKKAIEMGMDDARGYGMLGRVCVESGRLEEAKEVSIKAFKLDSNNPMSSINLGIYYSLKSEFDMAMDYFDIAAKLAPNSHRLFAERGLHYARVGMIHEALADLKEAINLQPCNQDYYHNMSDIYMSNYMPEEAKKVLNMSVENRPGCAESHFSLAEIFYNEGIIPEAAGHIEQALELSPGNDEYLELQQKIQGKE